MSRKKHTISPLETDTARVTKPHLTQPLRFRTICGAGCQLTEPPRVISAFSILDFVRKQAFRPS